MSWSIFQFSNQVPSPGFEWWTWESLKEYQPGFSHLAAPQIIRLICLDLPEHSITIYAMALPICVGVIMINQITSLRKWCLYSLRETFGPSSLYAPGLWWTETLLQNELGTLCFTTSGHCPERAFDCELNYIWKSWLKNWIRFMKNYFP